VPRMLFVFPRPSRSTKRKGYRKREEHPTGKAKVPQRKAVKKLGRQMEFLGSRDHREETLNKRGGNCHLIVSRATGKGGGRVGGGPLATLLFNFNGNRETKKGSCGHDKKKRTLRAAKEKPSLLNGGGWKNAGERNRS